MISLIYTSNIIVNLQVKKLSGKRDITLVYMDKG